MKSLCSPCPAAATPRTEKTPSQSNCFVSRKCIPPKTGPSSLRHKDRKSLPCISVHEPAVFTQKLTHGSDHHSPQTLYRTQGPFLLLHGVVAARTTARRTPIQAPSRIQLGTGSTDSPASKERRTPRQTEIRERFIPRSCLLPIAARTHVPCASEIADVHHAGAKERKPRKTPERLHRAKPNDGVREDREPAGDGGAVQAVQLGQHLASPPSPAGRRPKKGLSPAPNDGKEEKDPDTPAAATPVPHPLLGS